MLSATGGPSTRTFLLARKDAFQAAVETRPHPQAIDVECGYYLRFFIAEGTQDPEEKRIREQRTQRLNLAYEPIERAWQVAALVSGTQIPMTVKWSWRII